MQFVQANRVIFGNMPCSLIWLPLNPINANGKLIWMLSHWWMKTPCSVNAFVNRYVNSSMLFICPLSADLDFVEHNNGRRCKSRA